MRKLTIFLLLAVVLLPSRLLGQCGVERAGPSFHRYQMVLFTLIPAVIFVAKTASALVMPEFDTTLLGLMGISSGTYLGFKLQGK
jgi:hypothetical protein